MSGVTAGCKEGDNVGMGKGKGCSKETREWGEQKECGKELERN